MSEWKCLDCGAEFDRPDERKEDDELKYSDSNPCCPNCESFDIEEVEVNNDNNSN